MKRIRALVRSTAVALAVLAPALTQAADYRVTAEQPTILYDGPSAKAKPLFLYGRDVPLELIVAVEGWAKVRDPQGAIGWVDRRTLGDRRMLVVRAPVAEVRTNPDETAPVAFRAERDVLLEINEPAASPSTTSAPGWVRVRHRDGASGFVRISQVFGL